MDLRKMVVCSMLLVSVSCLGQPVQTYSGPELPLAQVALLRGTSNASILAIDGARVSGFSWSLLPGGHSVWLRVRVFTKAPNVDWDLWTHCRVDFVAVAGEEYVGRVRVREEVSSGFSETVKIQVGIADSEGIFRAAPNECHENPPKLNR